jgi:hypothetical protein
VGVICAIVWIPASSLARTIPDHLHHRPIGRASVPDDYSRFSVSLHCFFLEFQRGDLIPLLREKGLPYFAVMTRSGPEVVSLTQHLHEDLVEVPIRLFAPSHRFRSALPVFMCEVGSEPVHPVPDAFMANVDAALVEQVLCVSKRERRSDVHHHAQLDDLRRCFEVAKRIPAIF